MEDDLTGSQRAADSQLLRVIQDSLDEAFRRSGSWLLCAVGCSFCCTEGPFPITLLDAERLQRGWRALAAADPERAARIRNRADEAFAKIASLQYPGNTETGCLEGAGAEEDLYHNRFKGIPCPVLDLETGACQIYEHRPVCCRVHGPALSLDGSPIKPCVLNYQGASEPEIEQCRVDISPGRVAEAAFEEFVAHGGAPGRTIISYAVSSAGLAGQKQ